MVGSMLPADCVERRFDGLRSPHPVKEWRMPARECSAAKAQFAVLFEDRFAIT
jgi:hypothetical protein